MSNAADPQKVAEADAKAKRKVRQEDEDLCAVMQTPSGRRVIWRILCGTGARRSSFTGNSETFFREGERNVGLRLQEHIERVAFDMHLLMQKEAHEGELE
jgi:hypothetical protein